MVYWIEFGDGFRERGYDSLPATRRYIMKILKEGVAKIYTSKNSSDPIETIVKNIPTGIFYTWSSRSGSKPILNNGALKQAPGYNEIAKRLGLRRN